MVTNLAMLHAMLLVMLLVMLLATLHLEHHMINRLLHSRLAHSLEHTIANQLQTAIPIDLMTISPAKQHMRRHHQPTMRMRITVVAWNKSSVNLVFQPRIPARTLTQIVSVVDESARFARQSVKVARRMATTARHPATMINLRPLVVCVPVSRTMPARHPVKALGRRRQQTPASKSFAVALAFSTLQWTQVLWHRSSTTVRARSERIACVSSTRHRKRTTRGQRAY
jgi:hypothetical protein